MNFKLSLIATASVLLLSMVASCKHSNLPVNMYGMNQFYPSPCRTNYVCGVHVKVLDPCTIQYFHPSQHYSNHQNIQVYLVDVNNMYYPVQTHLPHYHQQQQQTSIIDVSHYGFQNLVGLSLHDSLSGAYLGQINFKNNQIGSNSAVTRFVDQNFVLNHVQTNNQLHGLQNHLHSHLYHECNSGEIWSKDVEKCVLDKGDLSGNNKDITTGTESPTILQPVVPTTTEVSMTPTPTNSANLVKISALSLLLSAVILFI